MVPLIPKFMQETEELKGASRGSAYHKVLELLDFSEEYKEETFGVQLGEQIRRFQEEGRLSKEMADCIRLPDILRFLNSGAGKGCGRQREQDASGESSRLCLEFRHQRSIRRSKVRK